MLHEILYCGTYAVLWLVALLVYCLSGRAGGRGITPLISGDDDGEKND